MPTNLPYNEKELLIATANGDEHAFRKLFDLHRNFLGTHIFRIVESKELMEEIIQDVFLKIWLTREVLPEIDNFRGYLVIVSRNQALNALNSLMRELRQKASFKKEPDAQENEVQDVYQAARFALLDEAIDALPPRQKEIFLLHRHARLTYLEIAQKLGIGKETVKSQLKSALLSVTAHVKARIGIMMILFELLKK